MHEYVMEQNAMDDKIIERCKTCKKQCTQEDLGGSRVVELLSSRSQPRWIEHLSSRHKLSQWIENLSRSYQDCDKKKLKSSIDSLVVERCPAAVEIA